MSISDQGDLHSSGRPNVLVVIPARFQSSRFPGKPLADLAGKPLIVRVVENAHKIKGPATVIVATDDERIFAAVTNAGYQAEMTGDHATGTDRIGEVAARHSAGVILNLQGDEPLLDPTDADKLIEAMLADDSIDIGTLAHPFTPVDDWTDPNTVKVIVDQRQRALYFSRAPIPGHFPGGPVFGSKVARRHVGIYAFRRSALEMFLALERTPLEMAEGLEQLRALENGMQIKVLEISRAPVGVDTPEDLEKVRKLWANP
jgi:3-deoxy-D-manno-octulosonate cytidylyltransferase